MQRLKDLYNLMANNVTVNENRSRLKKLVKNKDAVEFWATQFGSALRVRTDDFFMRYALGMDNIPQEIKDLSLEEKKIFCDALEEKYDDDKSGDITPIELDTFFNDMEEDKFFIDRFILETHKRK